MKQLIIEAIKSALLEQPNKAPMLNESKQYNAPISEEIRYHISNKIQIHENIFRPGSKSHIELIHEARILWKQGIIELLAEDKKLFENTDLGRFGMFEGEIVPLDLPMIELETLTETELEEEKKQPALGKPKRGGSKKFYVYVKDPKTKRIKKYHLVWRVVDYVLN